MLLCIAIGVLAQTRLGAIGSDLRLAGVVSARHEIISLSDLAHEFSVESKVQLRVRKSISDRKVTIVFLDRPLKEAMAMLATTMLMEWRPITGGGYELNLTDQEAIDERRTAAMEDDEIRSDVAFSLTEIRRLAAIPPSSQVAESNRIDSEIKRLMKSGAAEDSLQVKRLKRSYQSLHISPGLEFTGPALQSESVTIDSLLSGTPCFVSLQRSDPVPHLDPQAVTDLTTRIGATDLMGIVWVTDTLRLQTDVIFSKDGFPGSTRGFSWPIFRSLPTGPSPLDKAMEAWCRDPDGQTRSKSLAKPDLPVPKSEFASGKFGRAQHLLFIADQTGIPVIGDAFRIPLTAAAWLPGKTLGDWLDAYRTALKSSIYKPGPENVRLQDGWLLFRKDHWWQRLATEIPESVLVPLESQARKSGLLLSLDRFAKLAGALTPSQCAAIGQEGRGVLFRFLVGNFSSAYQGLRLYSHLDANQRSSARSNVGLDLATANSDAQDDAYKAIFQQGIQAKDIQFIRALFPGSGFLRGFKFFADDVTTGPPIPDLHCFFNFGQTLRESHHLLFQGSSKLP